MKELLFGKVKRAKGKILRLFSLGKSMTHYMNAWLEYKRKKCIHLIPLPHLSSVIESSYTLHFPLSVAHTAKYAPV